MKRVLRTTMMALLIMILCVGMLTPAANAAGYEPVSAVIPVTIFMESTVTNGDLPVDDAIAVTVETLTSGSPAADPASFVITSKSADGAAGTTGSFTVGEFTVPGEHQYGVTIGTSTHDLVEGDEPVYYVVDVQVFNNDSYTGLYVNAKARLADSNFVAVTEDKGAIEDTNYYVPTIDITVVKKWVDQDSTRPGYIEVELLGDGKQYDKKDLSPRNEWQYTWENLDSRIVWEVKEDVPAGYFATYKFDPETCIWYITNTGSLLQTGQLNWPIPILAIAGFSILALGIFMMRKKEENDA